jgi:hypothetical protein
MIAFGPEEFGKFHDSSIQFAATGLRSSATTLVLVPVGLCGQLLWKRLDWNAASLVASPDHDAIAFCRASDLEQTPSGSCLWERLAALAGNSTHVTDPLDVPDFDPRLPLLAPKHVSVPDRLAAALSECRPAKIASAADATALESGLFQVHDDLDRSHSFSQSIEGAGTHRSGDYWHAIMHRREPDYGNSKYWFRQVGQHPIFNELADHAVKVLGECRDPSASDWRKRLTNRRWEPMTFVDLCQECAKVEDSELGIAARRIQWIEMLLLLERTWRDAIGA